MKRVRTPIRTMLPMLLAFILPAGGASATTSYVIVDTGQDVCYDETGPVAAPGTGEAFHGQDAQYAGNAPSYTLAADGLTALDDVTGLTWQRSPDTDLDGTLEPGDKLSWWDALDQPAVLNAVSYGGYDDWRLPSIKELYSLIDFSGVDPSGYTGDVSGLVPFLDTDVFAFIYGDESLGERIIDSQYWSATEYVGTTMNGDHTVFGVNFADGRIKGYGTTLFGSDKTAFVLCVRGNPDYGMSVFVDNGDETVTDEATGLMWQQSDSGVGMDWEHALEYAENLSLGDHDDWRLPNAKELQSLLDYTRSPSTSGSAAIDPLFGCSTIIDEGGGTNYPFYWTGTTHTNWSEVSGGYAAYVCFGEALGWMQAPFPPFDYTLMDVHGAGAQRSDPKQGDAADWPYGHGPQGDVIRIDNFVRCVRDAGNSTGILDPDDGVGELPDPTTGLELRASPNPFNPAVELRFSLAAPGAVTVSVHDAQGRLVAELLREALPPGEHVVNWNGTDRRGRAAASGLYLVRLDSPDGRRISKITLSR